MRNRKTTGITIMVALMLLAACGERDPSPPTHPTPVQEKPPEGTHLLEPPGAVRERLRVEPVRRRSIPDTVRAPGEVALDLKQVAKITSRIEGQAEKIHVQLGDRVKPGQPLVAIRSLQFDQLIEEYLVAKAQADVAENAFRRTAKLRVDDIVPERKLIEDKGRHLEAQARYQHIREKLLNMGLSNQELVGLEHGQHEDIHRYVLTAPIAGTVVSQHVVRGQGVAPGLELFEVVDTRRVWVFANLPIEQARKFKEGDIGTITPKGAEPLTAPLTYIAPVADETTRTIQVRLEVDNPQGRLKPREYVEVTLVFPGLLTLAVPVSAVTTAEKVRGVFIERDAGYAFVPIAVGQERGGWIAITKGITEGDRVVVEGVFDLKNLLLKDHIESGDEG